MVRSIAAALAAVALVGAGCMVVTGSTDGYTPQPGPCQSAADCSNGNVCCAGIGSDGKATLSCQGSCDQPYLQLCLRSGECEAGVCYAQYCTPDGGSPFQVATCAPIPFCSQ